MALSKEQVQQVIKLKQQDVENREEGLAGMTNQSIAEEVLGSRLKESSVRRIWKEFKKAGNYRGITLEEMHITETNDTPQDTLTTEALENLCESKDFAISNIAKRLRTTQRTNTQLRKIQRELFDGKGEDPKTLEETLEILSTNLSGKFYEHQPTPTTKVTNKTVEVAWGDWQWGKISESWNTEIANRASAYYGQELLKIIKEVSPEKIIFVALGDNIEDALKHGVQSTASTDTSNAEQIANCIEKVWFNILAPLVSLNIPLDFVGVCGNHGSNDHKGMDMFKAGRYCIDYTLYRTWENMCKIIKAGHVTFNLPEGHFATYSIYGKLTVAEHGYQCKGSSENAMIALRNKRSTNLQQFVHRLLVGDMHHYCNYDNANLQVNGSAFGVAFDAIEYSGIMGFHAVPVQIVNIHEPVSGVGQNTVVETKVIQVAKGYDYEG